MTWSSSARRPTRDCSPEPSFRSRRRGTSPPKPAAPSQSRNIGRSSAACRKHPRTPLLTPRAQKPHREPQSARHRQNPRPTPHAKSESQAPNFAAPSDAPGPEFCHPRKLTSPASVVDQWSTNQSPFSFNCSWPSLSSNKGTPRAAACRATYTTKKGRRRNRLRIIPLFLCNECGHRFASDAGKYKSYPLKTSRLLLTPPTEIHAAIALRLAAGSAAKGTEGGSDGQ